MTSIDPTHGRAPRQTHRRAVRAVAAVGSLAVLAACSGGGGETSSGGTEGDAGAMGTISADALPAYVPIDLVEPDFPSVNGSTPGFLSVPDPLVKAFDAPPGTGGTYTAMTPLWGTIPPTEGNAYFDAVNEAIGTDITFQISDGNTYGDKLAAVLSSPKDVADWVSIPTWNVPPRFGQAVDTIFEDLTPYLAGDAVEEYPYLASIPTEAWKTCAWNGKIYGLPFPQEVGVGNWVFYRSDLLPDAQLPTNADELIAFAEANTKDRVWGTNDLVATSALMHEVPPDWALDENDELIHRFETPEYRAHLEWMADLYASGAVHPDAVADNQGDAGTRFESGSVMMTSTGVGYWHEALTRNRAGNPDWNMTPLPVFAADGSAPVVYKSDGASMCSYLKKSDDDAAIEELLSAANFLASPFGTEEFQLINYGVEGTHYTVDANGLPVPTELAQTEVQPSYIFLVDPPVVNAKVTLPDYVEQYSAWTATNSEYVVEPLFYGMNITEPNQFASLGQPFVDLEKDIARGRKSMDDLDAALETWRASGGEELRAFYTEIYEAQQAGDENSDQ
ncbi:extracellular solute-binding protein [Cellulomonas shaoxiangyii]|uniref:Extracellular solute-binding protein n=1 Tax=Cellulomonas shaoxiangyii TaxID=2566013 RepID=A0A4P7SMA8_9CELL|nr:extracellular solute-binding protein [Cellulomonas shaoxiangyii]QCB94697.1 extracellular solute-binding protein [Cellulomonas shaoxiangyii]TGY85067.1 extracellular solute-binding protein [Cellulomonas shaoxiangyii]